MELPTVNGEGTILQQQHEQQENGVMGQKGHEPLEQHQQLSIRERIRRLEEIEVSEPWRPKVSVMLLSLKEKEALVHAKVMFVERT